MLGEHPPVCPPGLAVRIWGVLLLAEADCFLHGDGELAGEVLVVLVVGQVEAVEAVVEIWELGEFEAREEMVLCSAREKRAGDKRKNDIPGMRLGQGLLGTGFLNSEPPRAIASLEIFEAIDGDTGCARCELQEPGLLLGVPAADTGPEVPDDLVLLCVAPVVGVFLPVFDIDVGDTSD